MLFIERIVAALQLDKIPPDTDFAKIKKAFTPSAVRKIHEAIPEIWPDHDDYVRCLNADRNNVSALYTGYYELEAVFRALVRHSLYSDRILLPDPFMYPPAVRNEFSPILHPEQYRTITVKWSFLWISLIPWIASGIVNLIRTPIDFSAETFREIVGIQREKFESNPELKEELDSCVTQMVKKTPALDRGLNEYLLLSNSDEYLLGMFRQSPGLHSEQDEQLFLKSIQERRDAHPYFVDRLPGQHNEFLHGSTGACYETAKRICAITNSYILTDIPVRWKEVELDHKHATAQNQVWAPFAKALQNADLKVLNSIPLQAAFRLREEQRLEQMRCFFNRVWRGCREGEPFSEANAVHLAAELDARIREAKEEWEKIDKDLVKWLGGLGAAAGALLTSGVVGFVPAAAAAVLTGATALGLAQWQRKSFKNRFPAGFFLGMEKDK
jgi:hypothetical protein